MKVGGYIEDVQTLAHDSANKESPVGFGTKRWAGIPRIEDRLLETGDEERFWFDNKWVFLAGRKQLGIDTCNGDSGGPVIREIGDSGEYIPCGVTSRAIKDRIKRCGEGGIYTRPYAYLDDFMKKHVTLD